MHFQVALEMSGFRKNHIFHSPLWRCRSRGKPNEQETKKYCLFQYAIENLFYFKCESMRNVLLIRESLCIQFQNVNVDERMVYEREREREGHTRAVESVCVPQQTHWNKALSAFRYLFFYFSAVFSSTSTLFWSLLCKMNVMPCFDVLSGFWCDDAVNLYLSLALVPLFFFSLSSLFDRK